MAELVDLPSPTNSEAAAMPSERLKQKVLSLSQQCETLRATLQERDAAAADRLAPQQAELDPVGGREVPGQRCQAKL